MSGGYARLPNVYDEDDRTLIYDPVMVDRSLRAVLEWRGVPERRIAALLVDLDDTTALAEKEIDCLLPAVAEHTRSLRTLFDARLAEGVSWNGERLTIERTLPDAVVAGMTGRTLRAIVDHPALPDRVIERVEHGEGRIRAFTKTDPVEALELSRADQRLAAASKDRSQLRRGWIDAEIGEATCMEWCDALSEFRPRALAASLSGEEGQISDRCWGEPPETSNALVRVGRRIAAAWRGVTRWANP